jgi:lipoprotein-anchoring transpeptidase ErfK/SrfK
MTLPQFLLPTVVAAAAFSAVSIRAQDRQYDESSFTWNPSLSPSGPVVVSVNLKSQTAAVYRNGIEIGSCIVSTGRPGHETPKGTFQILQKDADHHSSTYNNASMPFTERLTWGGVALHAGGCRDIRPLTAASICLMHSQKDFFELPKSEGR